MSGSPSRRPSLRGSAAAEDAVLNYDPELAALLSQPWSEGACRGYVISAMERCGFKPADIQQVMMELHEIFDYTTLEEARAYYERSPY